MNRNRVKSVFTLPCLVDDYLLFFCYHLFIIICTPVVQWIKANKEKSKTEIIILLIHMSLLLSFSRVLGEHDDLFVSQRNQCPLSERGRC